MSPSRSSRFVRNFSWNLGGQAGLAALNFAFIPYLVGELGLERYGLYVLLHAATNYLSLFAFGAGSTTIKFVAESVGARDGSGLRQTLRYSAAVHAVGALAAGAALAAAAPWLAERLFRVQPALLESAVFVLRCAAGASFFWAMTQWGCSALQGLQRFDAHNGVALLQNGLVPVGAAALVAGGYGLRGAALWYVAANAAGCLAAALAARRLLKPALALPPGPGYSWGTLSAWGLSLWLGPLAWLITFQADKLYIARAASLAALTLYSVPASLLQRLQVVPTTVSAVALPMLSELRRSAPGDLARVYLKAQRLLLWIMLPLLAALFALMPQFLGLWLGSNFAGRSVWPARLLVLAQAFLALNCVPNAVAASCDRPWWVSAVAWAQALVSVVAWKLLIGRYELLGVALGSLLAQALPCVVYLTVVHARLLRLDLPRFWSDCLRGPVVSASVLLAFLLWTHERAGSWAALCGVSAAGAALYLAVAWSTAGADDRGQARALAARWGLT